MLCHAFIIAVINASHCLTINADSFAWVRQGAGISIMSLPLLSKALTAGVLMTAGVLAAHHNVSLAAVAVIIIGTVCYRTF